jgi:hypothetical protein
MAKKGEKKETIRTVELYKGPKHLLEEIIIDAEKGNHATREEIMEAFYGVWEAETKMGEKLRVMGINNKVAQKVAVSQTKGIIGRKVTRPVHDVFFRPVTIQHKDFVDEKTKRKEPHNIFFGQGFIINQKTGRQSEEKLLMVEAWRKDVAKVEDLEVGKVYKLEAACPPNYTGNVIQMVLDDRCGDATLADDKVPVMTEITELLTQFYDVIKIRDAMDYNSESRFDFRLFSGTITYINTPKDRDYAVLGLTDDSVTLHDLEKHGNKINLKVFIDKSIATKYGKDSWVMLLGKLNVQKAHPQYGDSALLSYPPLMHPIFLVEPEVEEDDSDDDKDENVSDYYPSDDEDQEVETEEEEEETTDDEVVEEEPEAEPVKEEPEPKAKPKKRGRRGGLKEKDVNTDPFKDVRTHECWTGNVFGDPDEGDEGCIDCLAESPDVYKLCHRDDARKLCQNDQKDK